jgi:hypothetical protein
MTSKPTLTDFGLARPSDHVSRHIEQLVRDNLAGKKVDGIAFVDELLSLAQQVGELRCGPAGDHGLRFEVRGSDPFEVGLDANMGKLRMLCARLAVLCQENGHEFMPYGGEGLVRRSASVANGNAGASIPRIVEWRARWTNTPGRPEFTIHHQPE